MEQVAAKVKEEMARFREALPTLLQDHEGKWVVFRDGEVASVHDDEESAYQAGLERFGRSGGHVVALVEKLRTVPLTAAVLFARG